MRCASSWQMSWIQQFLPSNGPSTDEGRTRRDERFPSEKYGPGYPIVIDEDELGDIHRLLEIERDTPDGWENSRLLSREDFDETVKQVTGIEPSGPDEYRNRVREIADLWQEQLIDSRDAVWTTVGTDTQFRLYITQCEVRAEAEDDSFEEPPELDTVRAILNRIETVQKIDSKLVMVHRDHLPLDEAEEDD